MHPAAICTQHAYVEVYYVGDSMLTAYPVSVVEYLTDFKSKQNLYHQSMYMTGLSNAQDAHAALVHQCTGYTLPRACKNTACLADDPENRATSAACGRSC